MREQRYLLKIHFEWEFLFPLCIILFLIGMAATDNFYRKFDGYLGVYSVFEIYLPLLGSYILAGLLPDEVESGFLEMLFTYPPKKWKLLFTKLITAVLILILMFIPFVFLLIKYYELDLTRLLIISVPPVTALGGLVLLISILTKHKISSMLFAGAYWAFEIFTKGTLTGKYSLYYASYFGENSGFIDNRIMLMVSGLILILAALVVIEKAKP